jgi:hypothetical protein
MLIAPVATLRGDPADEFRQGILAADRKEWNEVVKRMRAAIAQNPTESRNRVFIYGVHYEPYLPHLWLGLAYSNLSDCDAALRELGESEKQVEIVKTTRYRDLQIASYQCQKKVAAKPPDVPPPKISDDAVSAAAASAQEQIDATSRVAQQAAEAAKQDQSLAERFTQASSHLNSAKRRFEAGKSAKNPSEINAAADMASNTRGEFDLLMRDATRLSARIDEERQKTTAQQLQTEVGQRLGDARIAIVLASREKPRAALSTAISALQRDIDVARTASQITSPDSLRQLRDRLAGGTVRVQQLAAEHAPMKQSWPPAPLFEAAASFFNGNYKRTLDVLNATKFYDAPAASQALLFRAAAHFSLYVLGGEREAALRTVAVQEIRQCRAADQRTSPTLDDFSPRFVQFFATSAQAVR